jgi:hypothetical protein
MGGAMSKKEVNQVEGVNVFECPLQAKGMSAQHSPLACCVICATAYQPPSQPGLSPMRGLSILTPRERA